MMTEDDRKALRRKLGEAVMAIQADFAHHEPAEIIPEIIAALLSLANYIMRCNAHLSRQDFLDACEAAAREGDTQH